MKKLISLVAALSLFAFATLPAYANVQRVNGSWELNAPQDITFTCSDNPYAHTLQAVDMNSNGSFVGNGSYIPNNSYTWKMDGSIDEDHITFTLVYTGTNSGYTLTGNGVIADDGSIEGTTTGNCTDFAMGPGSATRFEGNHGQYVRSQEDKQAAAQSRVGMPVQSKGHTK